MSGPGEYEFDVAVSSTAVVTVTADSFDEAVAAARDAWTSSDLQNHEVMAVYLVHADGVCEEVWAPE